MLLTAGERISMALALLAMAISDLGAEARSHRVPGRLITDRYHGQARIIDVTPDASRLRWSKVRSRSSPGSRA